MNIQGYMDYNATTPVDPRVLEEMTPYFNDCFANPSANYRQAGKTLAAVEEARRRVARLIHADPKEVYFTSGGTESDNLAIFGIAGRCKDKGKHLITSAIEHKAVLAPFRRLEKEGFRLDLLPVDGCGLVDPETLRRSIRPDTLLVSVMHANNETGVIQPIRELAAVTHEGGALFHTDAVQSAGKIPLDVSLLGVDLVSISGHKIYGPKGVGALHIRRDLPIQPLIHGGGQEGGLRSGTENVPGIVGLGKAAELALAEMVAESGRLKNLRDSLQKNILANIPDTAINGNSANRLPNTLSITIRGIAGDVLLALLDQKGFSLSASSACSAKLTTPSHVLTAIGLTEEEARASIRISLGRYTLGKDLAELMEIMPLLVRYLRG